MIKRWSITETNPAVVRELSKGVGIDPLLATVLVQRGMSDVDQARVFFNPVISDLHDPFLMRDMDLAVECLAEAVNTNERILLYGDYDVDGTTSVALMYAFLKTFYKNIGTVGTGGVMAHLITFDGYWE